MREVESLFPSYWDSNTGKEPTREIKVNPQQKF
jgi:hypothetical protein